MIEVRKTTFIHRGATKFYTIITVRVDADKGHKSGLIITRWGKVGVFGQMNVEVCADIPATINSKVSQRVARGYEISDDRHKLVNGWADLKDFIGIQYWFNLGADNIIKLFPDLPDAELTMIKNPVVKAFEKDETGKWRLKDDPIKMPVEAPPTIEENISKNDKWGMF